MKKVDKLSNVYLPTPIQKLNNLSNDLGKSNMYIKRDDLTGIGMGGNKIRKLDYIIHEALEKGYDAVCTLGGVQTNHGRLTAAMAAKYGLKCIILCYGTPPKDMTGNLTLDRILDADIRFMDTTNLRAKMSTMSREEIVAEYKSFREGCEAKVAKEYEERGLKVFNVPIGGHSLLGTLGYLDCIKETMDQCEEDNIKLDYLVTGNGSGGTYAGLLLGAKYYNAPFKVIGVNISAKNDAEIEELIEHANEVSKEYELGVTLTLDDVELYSDTIGTGYNVPDEETRKVIYKLARREGIFVDPCYTGKSFAGFLKLVEDEVISSDSTSMFLHTGGTPALWTKEHLEKFEEELWKDIKIYEY